MAYSPCCYTPAQTRGTITCDACEAVTNASASSCVGCGQALTHLQCTLCMIWTERAEWTQEQKPLHVWAARGVGALMALAASPWFALPFPPRGALDEQLAELTSIYLLMLLFGVYQLGSGFLRNVLEGDLAHPVRGKGALLSGLWTTLSGSLPYALVCAGAGWWSFPFFWVGFGLKWLLDRELPAATRPALAV